MCLAVSSTQPPRSATITDDACSCSWFAGMERFVLQAGSLDPATEFDAERIYALAKEHGWRFASKQS